MGLQYMLDDTDIRDAQDHGAGVGMMGTSLGMDAIQEFTVLTNTYGAQFGGTGAAINTVSKSGTNNLHGSAYEYIRNSALDADELLRRPRRRSRPSRGISSAVRWEAPSRRTKPSTSSTTRACARVTGQTERAVVPVPTSTCADLFDGGRLPQGKRHGGWTVTQSTGHRRADAPADRSSYSPCIRQPKARRNAPM